MTQQPIVTSAHNSHDTTTSFRCGPQLSRHNNQFSRHSNQFSRHNNQFLRQCTEFHYTAQNFTISFMQIRNTGTSKLRWPSGLIAATYTKSLFFSTKFSVKWTEKYLVFWATESRIHGSHETTSDLLKCKFLFTIQRGEMLIRNVSESHRTSYCFGIPVFRLSVKNIVKFCVVS